MTEKTYQKLIDLGNNNILSEELGQIEHLQEHPFIIIKELREAIEILNRVLLTKYSHINKAILTTKLTNDFITKFDNCESNKEVYELIFQDKNKIVLLDKDGEEVNENYNILLDSLASANNKLTMIKDKKIKNSILDKFDNIDLAIYINGLPFLMVQENNLNNAKIDFKNLEYMKFLSYISLEDEESFIATNPNDFSTWTNYGSNPNTNIIEELLCNTENLLLYFKYGTEVVEGVLKNSKIHQYYPLKKLNQIFTQIDIRKEKDLSIKFKGFIQQSGLADKKFTMKNIVNLISRQYSDLYDKIYIISNLEKNKINIYNEFKNFNSIKYGKLLNINDNQTFIDSILNNNNNYLFLLNIENIDLLEFKRTNQSEKILFIMYGLVDFTFLNKRDVIFPNASSIYILNDLPYNEEKIFGKQIDILSNIDVEVLNINKLQGKYSWKIITEKEQLDSKEINQVSKEVDKLVINEEQAMIILNKVSKYIYDNNILGDIELNDIENIVIDVINGSIENENIITFLRKIMMEKNA